MNVSPKCWFISKHEASKYCFHQLKLMRGWGRGSKGKKIFFFCLPHHLFHLMKTTRQPKYRSLCTEMCLVFRLSECNPLGLLDLDFSVAFYFPFLRWWFFILFHSLSLIWVVSMHGKEVHICQLLVNRGSVIVLIQNSTDFESECFPWNICLH